MDNICFSIIVRDRTCQSGVPVTSEKVYTNVAQDEIITLQNGYTLTVSNAQADKIKLVFNNDALNVNVTFYILNGSYGIFDLPIDSGTYRVGVYSIKNCCSNIGGRTNE